MKLSSFFKAWGLAALLSVSASQAVFGAAIIDVDADGLDDVWEHEFGFDTDGGDPIPAQAALADPDHDGRTNLEESQAGTNPWSGEQPDGFFQAHADWSKTEAGAFAVGWQGVEGKVYQLHGSLDLGATWVEQGSPVEGTGGPIEIKVPGADLAAAQRFFWRLETVAQDSDGDGLDDEADLYPLDRYDGHRPLLLIAGEWTVKTTDAAGDPASAIGIEFRKWPAGAAEPEESILSTGSTAGNGCLTFNPAALATGDRVVAKLAGNAQQRVYLPWRPGSEVVDASPTPGGTGWSSSVLQGLLRNGDGVGSEPDLPDGGDPPAGDDGQIPLLRMCDIVSAKSTITTEAGFFTTLDHTALGKAPGAPANAPTAQILRDSSAPEPGDGEPKPTDFYSEQLSNGPSLGKLVTEDPHHERPSETSLDFKISPIFKSSRSLDVQANYLTRMKYAPETQVGNWVTARPAETLHLRTGATSALAFPFNSTLASAVSAGGEGLTQLESRLVMGPVPAHVPLDVLLGGAFYFNSFSLLDVEAELPFGKYAYSHLTSLSPEEYNKVSWTVAVVKNPQFAKINFKDAFERIPGPVAAVPGTSVSDALDSSAIEISFAAGANEMHPGDSFTIKVSAQLDGNPLGSFSMPFIYSGGEGSAAEASSRQSRELAGALNGEGDASAPGSSVLEGGQMTQTMEGERKIGLTGLPDPSAPAFVDALTGQFHLGEMDFALSIPGSDLALQVSRSSAESIWTKASGLRPNENPLLPFGPAWSSNVAAAAVWNQSMLGEIEMPGSVQLSDYAGRSYHFTEVQGHQDESPYAAISLFEPDPTLLPDRENAGISLTKESNNLVLRLPLLGITETYESASLQLDLPGNRDLPETSGITRSKYYRLKTVTDRFGNTLQWTYDLNGSATGKIIPDSIHVVGREALKLRFQQSNGRITSFWDPSGTKHSYTYNLDPAGSGLTVLQETSVGARTNAHYGYFHTEEADPRPLAMRLSKAGVTTPVAEGDFYGIPTNHLALGSFANGAGDTTVVSYELSQARQAYSAAASQYYPVAGDPLRVTSIDLPGSGRNVIFGGLHRLKPAGGSHAADMTVTTTVTDFWGHGWTYAWGTPQVLDWVALSSGMPSASALFFPSLTSSCGDLSNSQMTYRYDATAGYALAEVEDAAGRKTSVKHQFESVQSAPSPYLAPQVAVTGGSSVAVNSRIVEPSSSVDVQGFETFYTYTENERLPLTVKDHQGRVTQIVYGVDPLPVVPLEINQWQSQTGETFTDLLSKTTIAYHPVLKALPVKVTRQNTGILAAGDPAWVAPLVQTVQIDAGGIGWPAKTGYDANGDGDLGDAGDLASESTFSASGRVLEMRSPNGGTRSFAYDDAGLLQSICYEDGARVSFEYDKAGRVALTRDPLGNASGTAYNVLGRVVKSIRDVEGGTALAFNPSTGSFSGVDAGHDLIGQVVYDDANGKVTTTDARGYIRVAQMDAYRRVVKSISPRADRAPGFEPVEDLNEEGEEIGDSVTKIYYDSLISPSGPSVVQDPLGHDTRYIYDSFGRLTEQLRFYGKTGGVPLYQSVKYGYDTASGLPSSVTLTRTPVTGTGSVVGGGSREELKSKVSYDSLDRPSLLIAGEGSGREIHRKFSYTSTGLPWQVQVRDDIAANHWQVTSSVYDALGRVTKQVLPQVQDAITHSNATPEFETVYGPDGSVQSVSDAYGNVTSFLYDVLGNSSQTLGPLVRDVRSGLDTRPASSSRYDAAGRTVAVTDPLARTWEYRWDAAQRLRASLGPVMNPTAETERESRAVTRYNPSLTGEDEVIDPEGHSSFTTYDATGQVRQIRMPVTSTHPAASSTPQNLIEKITRDLMGRVASTEDGEGHLTGFSYDGMGRLISRTWDPDDPARKKMETVSYDALLRTGRRDAKGQETSFTYDPQSFLLWKVTPAGKPAEEVKYLRDDLGRVITVDAADGVSGMGNADCSYAYDALGRLSSEVSNGKTMTYGYDLNGLPRSIKTSQNDRELRMTHDAAGRLTSLQDILAGDTRTTGFGYDVGGRLLREDLANGLVETSSYDRMGRLSAKQLRTQDWNVLCGSRYTYDFNSNVTSLRETTGPLAVPARTVTMAYDERGRLLEELQTGAVERTERHGYDLADNRIWTRRSEGTVLTARDYEYGSAANSYNSNQLADFSEQVGSAPVVSTSYSYDGNGNRIQRSRGGQSDTYVYDSFDRLVEMTLGTAGADNGTYRYAYDHASRRIGREVPGGGKRNFAFAGNSPALEWTSGGTDLTENIGGGVGGRLYSYETVSGTSSSVWDFHDARGDLLGQSNSSGGLFYRSLNDASGRSVADDGDRRGGYGANSKWEEPGGLVNDGFRYRDLDVGLFINRDPAGFIDGLNVYAYVGQNPWTMYDPFGLSGDTDGDGVVRPANDGGYLAGLKRAFDTAGGWAFIKGAGLVVGMDEKRDQALDKLFLGNNPIFSFDAMGRKWEWFQDGAREYWHIEIGPEVVERRWEALTKDPGGFSKDFAEGFINPSSNQTQGSEFGSNTRGILDVITALLSLGEIPMIPGAPPMVIAGGGGRVMIPEMAIPLPDGGLLLQSEKPPEETSGSSEAPSKGANSGATENKSPHGNSKTSPNLQHRYEIFEKSSGDVVKTGISGEPLNQNGTSKRANGQVNKLNAAEGEEIYGARVKETDLPGRQAGLDAEQAATTELDRAGNSLKLQQRPKPR